MVTEDTSKAVVPPKSSKSFGKANLPADLNYELLCCTVVPSVIGYYTHQKDPWDQPASILCNEIKIILKATGGGVWDINPKGAIYKNVHMRHLQLLPITHINL